MAAPVLRQSTALGTAHVTSGTVTVPAWGTATLNGSRIVVHLGINNFQQDGIDATCMLGTAPVALSGSAAVRRATSHDAVSQRTYQILNTGGTVAQPTIILTGAGTAVWVWYQAHEVTGSDGTVAVDGYANTTGAGSVETVGPSSSSSVSDVLWLGALTTPNFQPTSLLPGSPFSQISSASSGTMNDQSLVTALTARLSQTAISSVTMSGTASVNKQYAGVVVGIPAPNTGGFGGGGGAPRQFPLGPPDMTGATLLTDPGVADASLLAVPWAPTLSNTTDYILSAPLERSAPLRITGGGNVYVPRLNIKIGGSGFGEMLRIGGGAVGRIAHVENYHLDPNGFEVDAIKTSSGGSGRIVQLKTGLMETLIGQQTTTHADVFQAAGGVSELWVEDLTAHTAYNGFEVQQEASLLGTVAVPVTGARLSGTVATIIAPGHSLGVGQYVCVDSIVPSGYNGGFLVQSVSGGTAFTVNMGANSPGMYTSGGNVQAMAFNYTVGDLHFNRVNIIGESRGVGFTPQNAVQAVHLGARSAATLAGIHPNDDQTQLTKNAWQGTANLGTAFYAAPPPLSGADVGVFVEPSSSLSNWSTVRATYVGTASPPHVSWPNWSAVGGTVYAGSPPGGDFVVVSGDSVVATNGGTVTTHTPVNTMLPVVTPTDVTVGGTVHTTLGVWSNTDSRTTYEVDFKTSLGGTASYTTVQTSTGVAGVVNQNYTTSAARPSVIPTPLTGCYLGSSPSSTAHRTTIEALLSPAVFKVLRLYDHIDMGTAVAGVVQDAGTASRYVMLSIRADTSGGVVPASSLTGGAGAWNDMVAGNQDHYLADIATAVKAYGYPMWLTYCHEPYHVANATAPGVWSGGDPGSYPSNKTSVAAEWIAAYDYFCHYMLTHGVTNALFAPIWQTQYKDNFAAWLPAHADWIWNDSYPGTGQSFAQGNATFYAWAHANHPNTPLGIGETSAHASSTVDADEASWYAQVPTDLASQPQMKAWCVWDGDPWYVSGGAGTATQAAFETMANTATFSPTVITATGDTGYTIESVVTANNGTAGSPATSLPTNRVGSTGGGGGGGGGGSGGFAISLDVE